MSIFGKRFNLMLGSTVAIALAGALGCGSSSNDQGTSFLATGYFILDSDAADAEGAPSAGQILPLSSDVAGLPIALPNGTALSGDGLVATVAMQLHNRLATQFIRVVRIDCNYSVPGASIAIPSDSFPQGTVIQPTGQLPDISAGPDDGGDDTVTGPNSQLPTEVTTEFTVVSADLYAFLNVNRASLPELPFRMTATCSATGVTQAGDVLTTNSLNYFIQFVDVAECCTGTGTNNGGGFEEGPGVGGDFDSFDEEDTGSSTDSGTDTGTDSGT